MSGDKQIEEMARKMCRNYKQDGNCTSNDEPCALECVYGYCAERIYCADYRKASEVARDIFGNIKILGHIDFDGNMCIRKDSFEELEKIYTEEGK